MRAVTASSSKIVEAAGAVVLAMSKIGNLCIGMERLSMRAARRKAALKLAGAHADGKLEISDWKTFT